MLKLPRIRSEIRISIKTKLAVTLLSISLGSIALVAYLGWNHTRTSLLKSNAQQLTSVKKAKAEQLQSYFKNITNQAKTLSEDRMLVEAVVEFNRAYKELDAEVIPAAWYQELKTYYETKFFSQLKENLRSDINPNFDAYRPVTAAGTYLQYEYLVKSNESQRTAAFKEKSYYKISEKYDRLLNNLVDNLGYSNLYLVNYKTGDIIYSAKKNVDLGTSLDNGPYYQSNFAQAVQTVNNNPDPGLVEIVDFQPYRPALAQARSFIATPIYNSTHQVGILVLELDSQGVNNIMTGDNNWQNNGLGETAETYIVGSDSLMRSDSRLLVEDPDKYYQEAKRTGLADAKIQLAKKLKTSILLQNVDTTSFNLALNGESGSRTTQNYLNKSVLSSYDKLNISDTLNWVIISEKSLDEVYRPIVLLQVYFIIAIALIVILITLVVNYLAEKFVTPVNTLIKSIDLVSQGEKNVTFEITTQDEIGDLGRNFQNMLNSIEQKTSLLEEKNQENENLLRCMMPDKIAYRLSQGEKPIAENIRQATVIVATLIGFTTLSEQKNVEEAAALLNELIDSFDEAAAQRDVDKIRTVGKTYLAAAGVTSPSLDHTRQTIAFAHDIFSIIEKFNRKHHVSLGIRIGVETGSIRAGLIGTKKFMYEIWGQTVNLAYHFNATAHPNTICVSENVYQALQDFYEFEPGQASEFHPGEMITNWVIHPKVLNRLPQAVVTSNEIQEDNMKSVNTEQQPSD